MLAISVDPVDTSTALAHELGLAFPLLSDPELTVIRAYGVADEGNGIAWPSLFLIERGERADQGGRVRWRSTATSVSVRPTVADVLAAFDAGSAAH